jgi:hypothetical protein
MSAIAVSSSKSGSRSWLQEQQSTLGSSQPQTLEIPESIFETQFDNLCHIMFQVLRPAWLDFFLENFQNQSCLNLKPVWPNVRLVKERPQVCQKIAINKDFYPTKLLIRIRNFKLKRKP